MSNEHFVVGSLGWDHAQWVGLFYPDDLPEDWRLTYYANEFRGVLVPAASWRSTGADTLSRWLGDVPDRFLFFLEWSGSAGQEQVAQCAHILGSRYGGVVRPGTALMTAAESWDLRQLRVRFETLAGAHPEGVAPAFFLAGDPPDIGHLREAKMLAELLAI